MAESPELKSIDLLTRIELKNLTDPMRESLGLITDKNRRVLFPEGDDAISQTIRRDRIELGSILAVRKITVLIPIEQ
jgi:hypothetical protein